MSLTEYSTRLGVTAEQESLFVPEDIGAGGHPPGHAFSSPMAKALNQGRFSELYHSVQLPRYQAPSGRALASMAKRMLWTLIPSFIQSRISNEPAKPERLHPTAYLDGMRGLAAFAVFISHASYQTFQINFGYGVGEPGENTWLFQLPIVRLMYSGPPMVAIFFIISGYALSYKPLKLMRARSHEALLGTLSSSAFRRAFRLYLPCFASTFAVAVLCQLGVFRATQAQHDAMRVPRPDHHAWTAPTPGAQLRDWLLKMYDFVHPWEFMVFGGSIDYDRHLWTIPTEFRASMVLFLTHVLVARMRPLARMAFYAFMIYWTIHWNRWEMILFFAGALIAETNLVSAERAAAAAAASTPPSLALAPAAAAAAAADPEKASPSPRPQSRRWRAFWLANTAVALYLASYPEERGAQTPGYRTLGKLIPSFFDDALRFWPVVGAMQLVWAVSNAPPLQSLFLVRPVQYLGRVSFAVYLVHGPLIHTFGYAVMGAVYARTGTEPRWRLEAGFAVFLVLITAAVIVVADFFWRVVDLPCVRFSRWLEDRVVVRPSETGPVGLGLVA